MSIKKICVGFNDLKKKNIKKSTFNKIVHICINNNVRTFDLADNYYNGDLLKFFGKLVSKSERDNFYLINKFPLVKTKKDLVKNLDRSLKLLNSDYIDLYMPHWPSSYYNPSVLANFATEQIKKGKIKKFGLSNFNLDLIEEFLKYFRYKISIQTEININNFSYVKKTIQFCKKKNIDIFAYSINNNFPQNNRYIKNICSKKKISQYEMSLYWLKNFQKIIPIIRSSKELNLKKNFNILRNKTLIKQSKKLNLKNFQEIKISDIKKITSEGRNVYNSLYEALENRFNLFPGPKLIAEEIIQLGLVKPFYLKKEKGSFTLLSAQARFWAYQIAFKKKKTIPAIIVN